MKAAAEAAGIPVFQFERTRKNPEALDLLDRARADLCVVVAFGQILPVEFFSRPPLGTINIHASILPFYRGAAPIFHAILNGEKETGISIMKIDAGMDTGDVLEVQSISIPPEATAGELSEILARLGADLLVPALRRYASGERRPQPQDHQRATLAPRIDRAWGRVDWTRPALEIHNRIRACNPEPGAFTSWKGGELKLWRSRVLPDAEADRPCGEVLLASSRLRVHCGGGGAVELLEVQAPGKRRVSASDFVRGSSLRSGDILGA